MDLDKSPGFNLSSLPPMYILPTHVTADELHNAEESIFEHDGLLTYNAKEARIFLGRVLQKKRASFDLRARGVWTDETTQQPGEFAEKRRKLTHSQPNLNLEASDGEADRQLEGEAFVLKLEWLYDSIQNREVLPFEQYLVYSGRLIAKPAEEKSPKPLSDPFTYVKAAPEFVSSESSSRPTALDGSTVTTTQSSDTNAHDQASSKAAGTLVKAYSLQTQKRRRFNNPTAQLSHPRNPPKLHRTTTSEFEGKPQALPDPPIWVRDNNPYSCLRSTPTLSANTAFLDQLRKIKEARILTLDEIGVRAYSTSIASIAAYPYVLQSEEEVLRLPGCEQKIAALWTEWYASAQDDSLRFLEAVKSLERDEDLQHLKLFYEIWGVGADTARRFYFDQGWKDIDDIVQFGWTTLNRVQQIGVKFHSEFQVKIPRPEVEEISEVVLKHARSCRGVEKDEWNTDRDMVSIVVGGYRRGKELCGDVDIILSHREESFTKGLVVEVVASLEEAGWITHTLTLNTTTSDRNQQTLPYRGKGHGHGFDSLDKALCVWQNPSYDEEAHAKNPNIHRRVDIIISSWRTVGCAVLGWSGGTTFQRDIRRWVKKERGWKFDSSGVRDRANGIVLDLESPRKDSDSDTWLEREKRLMERMGIGWRPASERCTG